MGDPNSQMASTSTTRPRPTDSLVQSATFENEIKQIWELIAPFDFKVVSYVSNVEAVAVDGVEGTPGEVGALLKVTFSNGMTQLIRVLEVSVRNHTVSWSVVPTADPSSAPIEIHTIELLPVTANSHTYFQYTICFYDKVSLQDFMTHKLRVRDVFADFKRHIALTDDHSSWVCGRCTWVNTADVQDCVTCTHRSWKKYHVHREKLYWTVCSRQTKYESSIFELGRIKWRVLVFPRGQNSGKNRFVSVFIQALNLKDREQFPCEFALGVIHPQEANKPLDQMTEYKYNSAPFTFTKQQFDRGFDQLIRLDRLNPFFLDEKEDLTLMVAIRPDTVKSRPNA